jgi:L-fuconolactonase
MKIDSHQHFWKYDPTRDKWITAQMKAIQKDFLPNDIINTLKINDIDGTVAVQADQSENETDFLIIQANEFNWIKGIVGWVDLQAENITDRLDYYSSFNKLKGFRHLIQDEKDPDFLETIAFKNGISALQKHNFTYDILIKPNQLVAANEFVRNFPNQKFVLDHIAKPNIAKNDIFQWSKQIKELARNENVYCKLSGIVTENHWNLWNEADFKQYLDVVFEVFGTKRLMFGSDWPVCMLAAAYSQVVEILDNYMADLSENEQNLIWGQNAIDFYNLSID